MFVKRDGIWFFKTNESIYQPSRSPYHSKSSSPENAQFISLTDYRMCVLMNARDITYRLRYISTGDEDSIRVLHLVQGSGAKIWNHPWLRETCDASMSHHIEEYLITIDDLVRALAGDIDMDYQIKIGNTILELAYKAQRDVDAILLSREELHAAKTAAADAFIREQSRRIGNMFAQDALDKFA